MRKHTQRELAAELEDLRARLAEAEEALRAIRTGNVDAVLVAGERGEHVYTLSGADRIYRQLIETMSEGAVTLSADGVILYCNVRLAEMLGRPLDQVLGTALRNYLPPADQKALDAILAQARTELSRREINLKTSEGRLVPVYLSAARLHGEGAEMAFCLVVTDLTEQKSHEQIVAAERLARLILEQAVEAIIVCDEQGRVIRASQAAQQFCDGSPLLRHFAEVFPLRTDASDPFHLVPVLQGEMLQNVDVVLDRQGQKFDLILNAGPLLSGQQILGCVVTLTDITQRKRASQQLVSNYALLTALINSPRDIIIFSLDKDYRYTAFNRKHGEEMKKVWAADINIGDSMLDFMRIPELRAKAKASMDRALRGEIITEIQQQFDLDIYYEFSWNPVYFNKEVVGVTSFVRDITERMQAEEALRESEEKYRTLVENAAESILIAQDGMLKFVNRMASEITGYSKQELRSSPFLEFIHPDDRDMVGERYLRRLKGDMTLSRYAFRLINKDGTIKWMEIGAVVVVWEGKPATLNFLIDITERKRAEDQLRETLNGLRNALGGIFQVLSATTEKRDPYTAGHQKRVADLARAIGQEMGLAVERVEGLRLAGTIHDIGKISIPAEILSKPTRLTENEYSLIQAHPQVGYDILQNIDFSWPIAKMILQHHERMNESGYPNRLKGEEILLEARILAVADVVEAMASHRPYRPALGIAGALEEIEKNSGILYDSDVVSACLRLFREKEFDFK